MTFREACQDAIEKAKEHNVLFYVYSGTTMWHITPTYRDVFQGGEKWLFRAYPGGRHELSIEGKHILDREETANAWVRRPTR